MVIKQEPTRVASELIPQDMAAAKCCHHWVIEPAEGPTSLGVCRKCSESREFRNSIVDAERDVNDDAPAVRPTSVSATPHEPTQGVDRASLG